MKLRAMAIGDLLDAAIALYRRNFLVFVTIVALVRLPLTLVQGLQYRYMEQSGVLENMADPFGASPEDMMELDMGTLIAIELVALMGGLVIWLGNSISGGALAFCIAERYLGRKATVGSAYRFIARRLWRLIGVSVLVGLVVAIVGMGGAILVGGAAALLAGGIGGWSSAPTGMVIGAALGALPAIIPAVWFAFYVPVVVVENLGGIENMRRSYSLVRGSFWRVAGALLMLAIITFAAPIGLVTLPVASIAEQWLSGAVSQAAMLTIVQLVHQCALALTLPVWTAGAVLLYYDMRVRREAFDLEMLSADLASTCLGRSAS